MKKYLLIALSLLVVIGMLFTGCAQQAPATDTPAVDTPTADAPAAQAPAADGEYLNADGEKITIGFSVGHTTEERWMREIAMAEEWCAARGIKLIVQSADDDTSKQIEQCETMITNGVDAILCQAIDANAIGSVCDSAADAGVVIIAYERPITNPNCSYYIAFNSMHAGEIMAQSLIDLVPEGRYVYLHGDASVSDTLIYKQGSDDVLAPHLESGAITIVADQYCDGWSADEALKHTENALTANNNEIDAIIPANDNTAGGVIQALAAQGLDGKIPVSGMDGDIAACQRIIEGTQISTAFKWLPALNTAALELACDAVMGNTDAVNAKINSGIDDGQGGEVPTCWIAPVCVNKDNINEVVIASGYYTVDQVYANVPKEEWPEIEVTGDLDMEKWGWVSEYTPY